MGSSSQGSLSSVLEQDTLILASYWFNPGRTLPTSLKNWTSTKFVQIIALGPEMVPPQGSNVLHGLVYRKREKIFLSQTTGPRALIFGM